MRTRLAVKFGFHVWLSPRRRRKCFAQLSLFLFISLAVTGCGKGVGESCEIVGSGFHASDECADKCLSRWTVTCPDGVDISPKVCAGQQGCNPGGCPDGQVCYHFNDPFDKVSYCVPTTLCGKYESSKLSRWELESRRRAEETRAR